MESEEIIRQLEKNHEGLKIHRIIFISKDSQNKITMKLEIYQTVNVRGLIKMEWTLMPITFQR